MAEAQWQRWYSEELGTFLQFSRVSDYEDFQLWIVEKNKSLAK